MMWDSLLDRCFHAIIYFAHICSHSRPHPKTIRAIVKLRIQQLFRSQNWVNSICYTFHTRHNVALLIVFIFKFTFIGRYALCKRFCTINSENIQLFILINSNFCVLQIYSNFTLNRTAMMILFYCILLVFIVLKYFFYFLVQWQHFQWLFA